MHEYVYTFMDIMLQNRVIHLSSFDRMGPFKDDIRRLYTLSLQYFMVSYILFVMKMKTLFCWNVVDKSRISAQGCYVDNAAKRDLPMQIFISDMTIEACISACTLATYEYAAVQVLHHYCSQILTYIVDTCDNHK